MNGITSNCLSKSSFYWKGVFKPGARIRTVLNNDFKIELKLDNFFLKSCPLFLRKKQIVEGLKSQSTKTSNWLWLIIATGFVLSTNCEYKIVYANKIYVVLQLICSIPSTLKLDISNVDIQLFETNSLSLYFKGGQQKCLKREI